MHSGSGDWWQTLNLATAGEPFSPVRPIARTRKTCLPKLTR